MSNILRQNEIITTIGPSSFDQKIISELKHAGASCFRINLSHSNSELLKKYIDLFKGIGIKPSIDTQGAQIRIHGKPRKEQYEEGEKILIVGKDSSTIPNADFVLNHSEIFDQAKNGDLLRIDSGGLVIEIESINYKDGHINAVTINKGNVKPNKAVDVIGRSLNLKPLTDFDIYSISKYVNEIDTIFVSFTNKETDLDLVKGLIEKNKNSNKIPRIVAKIESKQGIVNLESILRKANGILIDRGDLSREISISRIPLATSSILSKCKEYQVPCYVATNVLDSMLEEALPSKAEISDLFNLYSHGVDGIVLAAEVAIGKYPVDCVHVVRHMYELFKAESNSNFSLISDSKLIDQLPIHLSRWL